MNHDPQYVDRQLVYLVYGASSDYRMEAKYSILSAIYCSAKECPRILVYTDFPDAFKGWPVEIICLDRQKVNEWLGEFGFNHRIKANAIRHSLQFAESSIYIDTDTFFIKSPMRLFERLNNTDWLVDEIEAKWGDWEDQPLYESTAQWLFDEYGVGDDLSLINSGVLGLHEDKISMMDRAIFFIDKIYPNAVGNHTIEQFCIGLSAYNLPKPMEANDIVCHYYSRKNFYRTMINIFFRRYSDKYNDNLYCNYNEVPKKVPIPAIYKKFIYKLKCMAVNRGHKKHFKLLYYSFNLQGNDYEKACADVYLDELIKYDENFCKKIGEAHWPTPFSYLIPRKNRCEITKYYQNRAKSLC